MPTAYSVMHTRSVLSLLAIFGLLHSPVLAQEMSPGELLEEARRVYPADDIPEPFSPGSASSRFSQEPVDPQWSPDMESRIRAAVAQEEEQGLIVGRVEVECRTSTCVLLLVHATDRLGGSMSNLKRSLREPLGFYTLLEYQKNIPIAIGNQEQSGRARHFFVAGQLEIVLTGNTRTASTQ